MLVSGQNDLKLVKSIFDLDLVRKVEFSMENQSCDRDMVNWNNGPDSCILRRRQNCWAPGVIQGRKRDGFTSKSCEPRVW